MTDRLGDDGPPAYRPGQVVNGHILNEDGTAWLPLAADATPPPSSGRRGLSTTAIVWLMIGGLVLVAAVAYASQSWTSRGNETAGSAPTSSAPAWLPAYDAWMSEGAVALREWNTLTAPMIDAMNDPYLTRRGKWDVFWADFDELSDIPIELQRLNDNPPAGVPPDVTAPMGDLAEAYQAKFDALYGWFSDEVENRPAWRRAARQQKKVYEMQAATQDAQDAWAEMRAALVGYWAPAGEVLPSTLG